MTRIRPNQTGNVDIKTKRLIFLMLTIKLIIAWIKKKFQASIYWFVTVGARASTPGTGCGEEVSKAGLRKITLLRM